MATLVETFTNIANAIRSKTGSTDPIPVSNMATAIANIESGGSEMCTVTVVNNSDDSITLYPKYEGCSDTIAVDRFESASITVPKQSAIWVTGWVPLGGYANPTTAGSVKIGSSTYDGMFVVYSDGTITINNN